MEEKIVATRDEYKGHQMIVLSTGPDDRFPFKFGRSKARRVLACIDEIEKFVADCELEGKSKQDKSSTKVRVR